ncbi:hypothetical protein [Roseinatronobacter sp. NSM]|uniref:hypothetical protein n=1 Tax=Roseinatronobacter sp. NSM TaxID=3457785 RepID=UPI004036C882
MIDLEAEEIVADLLTHEWDGDHDVIFTLDASAWTGNPDDILRKTVISSKKRSDLKEGDLKLGAYRATGLMFEFDGDTIRHWLAKREEGQ